MLKALASYLVRAFFIGLKRHLYKIGANYSKDTVFAMTAGPSEQPALLAERQQR